jgi:hypothetical protein
MMVRERENAGAKHEVSIPEDMIRQVGNVCADAIWEIPQPPYVWTGDIGNTFCSHLGFDIMSLCAWIFSLDFGGNHIIYILSNSC